MAIPFGSPLTGLSVQGTLTDGSAAVGTLGQLLSSTATGVKWVPAPTVASVIATVGVTNQSVSISTATLYAVPALAGGPYRISYTLKITQAATTSSSVTITLAWTDVDGSAMSFVVPTPANATNSTGYVSGVVMIDAEASTNVTYATTYASSGATAMNYTLTLRLEYLVAGTPLGLPTAPQVGDTIRYNVNGDSTWDAVNAAAKVCWLAVQAGGGVYCGGFQSPTGATVGGTTALVNPTSTDNPAISYTSAASASTSTVIYVQGGVSSNYGIFGFQAFYRWSCRLAVGNTTNVRYWMGLTQFNSTGFNSGVNGNTVMATDTPARPVVGFRYSAGTDSYWQAVVTNGTTQTTLSTGIAVDTTNPHNFDFAWNGTTSAYTFFIDGVNVGSISTNIPAATTLGAFQFWCGDNKNTATAIAATFYHIIQSLH